MKKDYIIVCEGSSEYAYLQELRRFLDDNGYLFDFIPKVVGCGHYKSVCKKYRAERKSNPKKNIKIWVDNDTYKRNDENDGDNYNNKPEHMPVFFFSLYNFEDFLALHLDDTKLENWFQICSSKGHISLPLHAHQYEPLVKKHLFKNYKKGEMPFEITQEKLDNLFKNNEASSVFFKCDFATFLHDLMMV